MTNKAKKSNHEEHEEHEDKQKMAVFCLATPGETTKRRYLRFFFVAFVFFVVNCSFEV